MRFIPLTNSPYSAIVDDEDYDRVMKLNTQWRVVYRDSVPREIYSVKSFGTKTGNNSPIMLSRFVWNLLKSIEKVEIDHIYGNIFDNRKNFTRKCSHLENGR